VAGEPRLAAVASQAGTPPPDAVETISGQPGEGDVPPTAGTDARTWQHGWATGAALGAGAPRDTPAPGSAPTMTTPGVAAPSHGCRPGLAEG